MYAARIAVKLGNQKLMIISFKIFNLSLPKYPAVFSKSKWNKFGGLRDSEQSNANSAFANPPYVTAYPA